MMALALPLATQRGIDHQMMRGISDDGCVVTYNVAPKLSSDDARKF